MDEGGIAAALISAFPNPKLQTVKLISDRQMCIGRDVYAPGEEIPVSDELGGELLKLAHVRRSEPPQVLYETKVVVPEAPEVSPRPSFRDVPLPDSQPAGVVAAGDPVLSGSVIPTQGTPDRVGRHRRPRPSPAR